MIKALQAFQQKDSWRTQATLALLALTIVLYPFNLFPHGPFMRLTLYPLVGLLCLNVDRIIALTRSRPLFRCFALLGGVWFLWILISLCLAVGPAAIEMRHLREGFNEVKRFVSWYTFVACCFLVPRAMLKRVLYWAFLGLFGVCSAYTILEALHFAGVRWASETLKVLIHGFMYTEISAWLNGNFWPPIFWDSQRYRSLFEEPAYFSVFSGFCALFFTMIAWQAKRLRGFIAHLALAALAVFFLCETKSAAGALALAAASGVWIVLAGCFWARGDFQTRWRMGVIALFLASASLIAIVTQRHPAQQIALLTQPKSAAERVLTKAEIAKLPPSERTVAEARAKPSGTNTRAIHLAMELKCIESSPIYGCGAGEYIPVMRHALQNSPRKTAEIQIWASPKNDPPKLNLFTGIAVTYGGVGLLLFLSWFMLPTVVLWIKQWPTLRIEQACVTAALGIFILCPMMSASMEIFCYILLATVPLLLVTEESA